MPPFGRPLHRSSRWTVHLNLIPDCSQPPTLEAAIRNHYTQQARSTRDDLKDYRHNLRQAFLYGGLFLGVCLSLHQMLGTIFGDRFPRIFDEGLIIIDWVALWRPAELLTYEWVPLVGRLRLQRQLSKLTLKVKTS